MGSVTRKNILVASSSTFWYKHFCLNRYGFQSEKVWSEWAYTNGILFLVMVILVISVIVVGLLFGCHSYLIVIGRTTWEHMAHSRISYLKIFKEGVNPFHEGYFKNVCTFLCHCRVRKWEKVFQRSSINLGVWD
jgi:hypothetical protein